MEISKYGEIIRACRYCPMCRHVCSSGNLSFHESDYPRGRGLLLDKISKGTLEFGPDIVESLYNCFLCGCCWANCEGGFELHRLIEASRKDIVDSGCQPPAADRLRETLMENGNPYEAADTDGDSAVSPANSAFEPANKKVDKKADILYFMGDNIKFNFHEIAEKTIDILELLGADYTLLSDEPTDGKILKLLGFVDDARQKAEELVKRIKRLNIRSVVVSDPLSYDAFKNDYPGFGIKLDAAVEHTSRLFTEFLEGYRGSPERYSKNRCEFKDVKLNKVDKAATLADSEFLGRFNSVYEEPRNLIQAAAESFVEMRNNRKKALATGEAAFLFNGTRFKMGPELGKKICDEARFSGAELIVTLSATARKNLRQGCGESGMDVMEISEFLWKAMINESNE